MASIVRLHLRFVNAAAANRWLEQASVLDELDDDAFESEEEFADPEDPDADEPDQAVTPGSLNLMLSQEYADGSVTKQHETPRTIRELLEGPGLELTVQGRDVTCAGDRKELAITDELRLVHALLAAKKVASGELQLLFVSFGFDDGTFHALFKLAKGVVRSVVVSDEEAERLARGSART